jgi:hypothetical protein
MKKELEQELIKTYPNLYSELRYGFEGIGDGWFLLIEALSKKLETMILALPEVERLKHRASQCKSKFATLRFYLSAGTSEMYDAIHEAEAQSAKTCEKCGRPGEIRQNNYWIRCECDVCVLLK